MNLPADLGVKRRSITVEAYHRMGEVGIIAPDERVERRRREVRSEQPVERWSIESGRHRSFQLIPTFMFEEQERGETSNPQPESGSLKRAEGRERYARVARRATDS